MQCVRHADCLNHLYTLPCRSSLSPFGNAPPQLDMRIVSKEVQGMQEIWIKLDLAFLMVIRSHITVISDFM